MVTTDGETCAIYYDKDSNGNTVNIFLLLPQYIVITIGEVSHFKRSFVGKKSLGKLAFMATCSKVHYSAGCLNVTIFGEFFEN